jgi:hypothetical protein
VRWIGFVLGSFFVDLNLIWVRLVIFALSDLAEGCCPRYEFSPPFAGARRCWGGV